MPQPNYFLYLTKFFFTSAKLLFSCITMMNNGYFNNQIFALEEKTKKVKIQQMNPYFFQTICAVVIQYKKNDFAKVLKSARYRSENNFVGLSK